MSVTKICFNSTGVESMMALARPRFSLFAKLFDEAKVSILVRAVASLPVKTSARILLASFLCISLAEAYAAPAKAAPSAVPADAPVPVSHQAVFADLIAGRKPGVGQVWKLRQHSVVFGDIDVCFNKNGLRTNCVRSGITVVAQAPRFAIVAYNVRANAIWKPTLEQFAPADVMLKSLTVAGLPLASRIPVVPSGVKVVNGVVCRTYTSTAAWTRQQIASFQNSSFGSRFPRRAEFQGVDLQVNPTIYKILEKLYGAPNVPLLPLNYSYDCLAHRKTVLVATDSCKIAESAKDWLKIPEGLKPVSSFQALNMDQAAQSGIDDLFSGLDR